MADDQNPQKFWEHVAVFPLPQGEGNISVSVKPDKAVGVWDEVYVGEAAYYHKPDGCNGPMRVVHVGNQKTVLCCDGCGLRMELRGEEGARPARIAGLRDVLAHMVGVENQI